MQNLISEKTHQEGFHYLQINPIGQLFSDSNYIINLAVCEEPACNCGTANIQLIKEENLGTNDFEYRIEVDVHGEKVKFSEKEVNSKMEDRDFIRNLFSNGLTSEDWQILRDTYFNYKFMLSEEVDPNEISFEFDDKDYFDDTLMFHYYELLPCSVFHQSFSEKNYVILDLYCKNPDCQCSNMVLDVLEIEEKNGKNQSKSIGVFNYNYKTGDKKIESKSPKTIESIVGQIFTEYDNLDKLFSRRNQIIKTVYRKSKAKFYKKRSTQMMARSIKVGRNEPCPCGSGKKYKKCCLN